VSAAHIASTYALVSAAASAFNVVAQFLFLRHYAGAHRVALSILFGTLLSLPVKYALDKVFVFHRAGGPSSNVKGEFPLYVASAIVTTTVFWTVELIFHVIFGSAAMRYLGAAIGLAMGYTMKYQLDSKYVFRCPTRGPSWSLR